jgi:threonine/homoserine efflux transporter RhtA
MLALLPATATLAGIAVLAQIPSLRDTLGVLLVMAGVAVHQPAPEPLAPRAAAGVAGRDSTLQSRRA